MESSQSTARCPFGARISRALLLLLALGCGDGSGFDDRLYSAGVPDAGPSAGSAGPPPSMLDSGPADSSDDASIPLLPCEQAVASEILPARSQLIARKIASSGPKELFTRDLFSLFRSHCGGCHVDQPLGDFQASLETFSQDITSEVLRRLMSDDPSVFMPPVAAGGKPFSERPEGDPVVELAALFSAWLAAGKPGDVFYAQATGESQTTSTYALDERVGMGMTNLGNCIPDRRAIASAPEEMEDLDAMFAEATELPVDLRDTDMHTLDAAELARERVVAFAPAYTLWADNAKKLRLVRVPKGEAITFDEESQRFSIPPNTRFYKTFFKRVIDLEGNERYRKIETRLILSRPDEVMPDGSVAVRALFGTYAWNEEETEALLVRDPLRSGEPFRDRLLTVVTDEKRAEEIVTSGPDDLQAALEEAGVTRTYAIPGSERCIHCHMGAPGADFVLGFLPVQIKRRPVGEGGVIEPVDRDELSQLERLIDYGVIDGIDSVDDVLPLEELQGDRAPRNDHELRAQGYMLGNCAHCHNPRGFPSTIAPELRDLLDFMPSEQGGIFEFPLERFSPRIFRGPQRDRPMPYITPSLYDFVSQPGESPYASDSVSPITVLVRKQVLSTKSGAWKDLLSPWRSLIYRNVDTPFSYAEDYAIFPKMPMDTASYDCRVRRLLGTWMTSIPARLKHVEGIESAFDLEMHTPEAQPYEEVLRDDPAYEREVRLAETRVRKLEESVRYHDCPDPSLDVVDPDVVRGKKLVPSAMSPARTALDAEGNEAGLYELLIPERPHWAVTDLTEAPGDWNPRRPDWQDVLVTHTAALPDDASEVLALEVLEDIRVTDGSGKIRDSLRELALGAIPFGTWLEKEDCSFEAISKVSALAAKPRWVDIARADPSAPVYEISAGAQVFTAICGNCHGPLADSRGRLAATIADMTGGTTRVANLRDGIFGPTAEPSENRARVFGEVDGSDLFFEDWAARYLLWMGLGGTNRVIPAAALSVVGNTYVLGQKRPRSPTGVISNANMLTVARALCQAALPSGYDFDYDPRAGRIDHGSTKSPLIEKNGDAELWERLCAFENVAPIRVLTAVFTGAGTERRVDRFQVRDQVDLNGDLQNDIPLYHYASYPTDARAGDHEGKVRIGPDPANLAPYCLFRPSDQPSQDAIAAYWTASAPSQGEPPYCPDAFIGNAASRFTREDIDRWTLRGAMNAGLAVFLYLDALAKGDAPRIIPYDRCEELGD